MELTRLLKGKTVFIDTAPFIYFIEKNSRYHQIVKPVISLSTAAKPRASPPPSPCLKCLSCPSEKANERLPSNTKPSSLTPQD